MGVTTSLSQAAMAAQAPDAVRRQIGEIRLEDLLALEYTQGERQSSGRRATTSGGGGGGGGEAAVRPGP